MFGSQTKKGPIEEALADEFKARYARTFYPAIPALVVATPLLRLFLPPGHHLWILIGVLAGFGILFIILNELGHRRARKKLDSLRCR